MLKAGWILLAAGLCTFLVLMVRWILDGVRLVHEGSHPRRNQSTAAKDSPYQRQSFEFVSADGIVLAGVVYEPLTPKKGTILACHYLGGSKESIYTYYEPLLAAGFCVACFDYPNHGQSGERKSSRYTLEEEMRRFIRALEARGVEGPYGTLGLSMGATIALSAVDTADVRAVMIDSGPLLFVRDYFVYVLKNKGIRNGVTRTVFLALYLWVVGFYRMSRRMRRRLRRLGDLPVLLIQSEKDSTISIRNARETIRLLHSKNAQLIEVKRSHHLTNRVVMGEQYDRLMVDFFTKWLVNHGNEKTKDGCGRPWNAGKGSNRAPCDRPFQTDEPGSVGSL